MLNKFITLPLFLAAFSVQADWTYQEYQDKMTGQTSKEASITSDNSLSLDFPYKGINHAHLTVRQHPKYGLDVILQIDKGQIICSSYQGCPIEVKFDNAQPIRFNGIGSADHDRRVAFLQSEKKFINQATKAKKILVQVNLYKAGAPVLEFSTNEPLAWQVTTAKPKK